MPNNPHDDAACGWEWPNPGGDATTHYSVYVSRDGLRYSGFVETESGERHAVGWTQTFEELDVEGPQAHVPEAIARELTEYVRQLRSRPSEGTDKPADKRAEDLVTPLCERLREEALRQGEIPVGGFRASVLESDHRISHHDFSSREEACAFANDAASETDDNAPIAYVFDEGFVVVHRGRPYLEAT
jgi:hypothetical protein